MINSDGTISPVRGSPFDEGLGQSSIIQVTADSKGRFVFMLNVEASAAGEIIGKPGICALTIDRTTGALTRAPGSPIVFPVRNDNNIAVDGSGHFLFEPNLANSGFDVYAIDQNSGALTRTSSTSNVPPLGRFSVTTADGRFLFNAGNGMVEVFSIDAHSGSLAAVGTPVSTAGPGGPIALTHDGKFLYAANQNQGTVMVFAIAADGALSPVNGSPFAIDTGAQFLTLTPDGKFLYVASFNSVASVSAIVKSYSVNPAAGVFTAIPGAVVSNADSVTIDLSGRRAYISAASAQSGLQLFIYKIDPASGTLTKIGQTNSPMSDDPFDMVTTP
jgi:6-phosphogluconolactonase